MRITSAILILLTAISSNLSAYHPQDFDQRLETIAFGSCNRQKLPQPLWEVIAKNDPDLWIWAGDNIYGDSQDPQIIAERYATQLANPDYQAFKQQFPIVGTWDDHDYGWNDAGKYYPIKVLTQQMALDFMDVPKTDPRRSREGIYGAYDFGPEEQRVKILLLDGRYFATGKNDEHPELVGEAQKRWLENELRESTAKIHIFVSGIQVVSEEHNYESWAKYPKDRDWLIDLLARSKVPGAIIISGDRHIHELSLLKDDRLEYPLLDATSSGLTHSWKKFKGEPNKHRIGAVHKELGFGLIQLNWTKTSCVVDVQLRDIENSAVNQHSITFPID
ncbi:MAG: alkaline phosphatase D family protein [Opitutaceae bacterium]